MKITYKMFDREITRNVFGEITFEIDEQGNTFVKFASGGHEYSISAYNVIKIENN